MHCLQVDALGVEPRLTDDQTFAVHRARAAGSVAVELKGQCLAWRHAPDEVADVSGTGDRFAATTLTCTVSGSALGCADTQHAEGFSPGDLIVVRASPQGAVLGVQMQWTARFAPRRP